MVFSTVCMMTHGVPSTVTKLAEVAVGRRHCIHRPEVLAE